MRLHFALLVVCVPCLLAAGPEFLSCQSARDTPLPVASAPCMNDGDCTQDACVARACIAGRCEQRLELRDQDGDGFDAAPCGPDCDDNAPDRSPWAAEICNSLDDDCDGSIDEDNPPPQVRPLSLEVGDAESVLVSARPTGFWVTLAGPPWSVARIGLQSGRPLEFADLPGVPLDRAPRAQAAASAPSEQAIVGAFAAPARLLLFRRIRIVMPRRPLYPEELWERSELALAAPTTELAIEPFEGGWAVAYRTASGVALVRVDAGRFGTPVEIAATLGERPLSLATQGDELVFPSAESEVTVVDAGLRGWRRAQVGSGDEREPVRLATLPVGSRTGGALVAYTDDFDYRLASVAGDRTGGSRTAPYGGSQEDSLWLSRQGDYFIVARLALFGSPLALIDARLDDVGLAESVDLNEDGGVPDRLRFAASPEAIAVLETYQRAARPHPRLVLLQLCGPTRAP